MRPNRSRVMFSFTAVLLFSGLAKRKIVQVAARVRQRLKRLMAARNQFYGFVIFYPTWGFLYHHLPLHYTMIIRALSTGLKLPVPKACVMLTSKKTLFANQSTSSKILKLAIFRAHAILQIYLQKNLNLMKPFVRFGLFS